MTIKRCLSCGNPFSDKNSKLKSFCSERCKNKYYDLLDNMEYSDAKIESDLKLKQKAQAKDIRRRKQIL